MLAIEPGKMTFNPQKLSRANISQMNQNQLLELCGTWHGIAKTWFTPDQLSDQSKVKATIKPTIADTFLLYEYKGTLMDEDMIGLAIIGYNKQTQKFEHAWIDNCHTGTAIMFSQSEPNPQEFKVKGDYPDVKNNTTWGWKTEITNLQPNKFDLICYNISPDGVQYKAQEINYEREI